MSEQLEKVGEAAARAAAARQEFDAAIREARDAGESLRAIAAVAGLSPEWVRRIAAGTEQVSSDA